MKIRRTLAPAGVLALAAGLAAPAAAQSSPGLFGTVYNIGTVPPGSMFDVPGAVAGGQVGDGNNQEGEAFITPLFLGGDTLGSDSQLNLFDGGLITGRFSVGPTDGSGSNTELNVFGGSTDGRLSVNNNGTLNIFGGTVASFIATSGGTVNLVSGAVPGTFTIQPGGTASISGGSAGRNGFVSGGGTLNISGGVVGAKATGPGSVGLTAGFDSTVNISGGSVGDFVEVFGGATVHISGGSVGDNFVTNPFQLLSDPITVNVSGGALGDNAFSRAFSIFNISGGTVGDNFEAEFGSTVNISGGFVGDNFLIAGLNVDPATSFSITGGSVGDNFRVRGLLDGAISGGTFGSGFFIEFGGSVVTFSGGAFQRNGVDVSGNQNLFFTTTDVLTGVLADGSVYIFAAEASDAILSPTSFVDVAVAPSANPGVLSSGVFTQGVRAGETLAVNGTGELGRNFAVVGGTLNIEGGSVGRGLEVAFGEVNITGGTVGSGFNIFAGSTVNISGGVIGDDFDAMTGATVNLFGSSFFLDGVELTDLVFGEALTITARDVTLSGLLADGSAFEFDLNSTNAMGEDFLSTGATLTVNLAAAECEGDTNGDNIVNFADLNAVLSSFGMQGAGDVNGDDIVNFEDLNIVLSNFGATCD